MLTPCRSESHNASLKSQKITSEENLPSRRTYDDACGAAHALDLIGERWALLVMRELFWGPKRFSDLRTDLPGISANVLTQRLEGLEASGIVTRRKLPPPANVQVYDLTDWGRESEPIFQALGRWAARSPSHDPTRPFSASSLLLSLRTMISPKLAMHVRGKIGFRFGAQAYLANLAYGTIDIAVGAVTGADVVFTGAPAVLAAAIYGGVPLEQLESDGALTVSGDRRLAKKFLTLFPLPEKVPPK